MVRSICALLANTVLDIERTWPDTCTVSQKVTSKTLVYDYKLKKDVGEYRQRVEIAKVGRQRTHYVAMELESLCLEGNINRSRLDVAGWNGHRPSALYWEAPSYPMGKGRVLMCDCKRIV